MTFRIGKNAYTAGPGEPQADSLRGQEVEKLFASRSGPLLFKKFETMTRNQVLWGLALSPVLLLRAFIRSYVSLANFISSRDLSARLLKPIAREVTDSTRSVTHRAKNGTPINLKFYTPNEICAMRARTFSTKEPEILGWIDEYGGGVLWDIGANIGLYSIYYALALGERVVAFEPSFFNLQQLAKNIDANGVSEFIDIVPLPLSDSRGISSLKLSTIEEGGALSAFGVDYGHDGQALEAQVSYRTLGITGDELSQTIGQESLPRLVKIDVDGIEPLILEGMRGVLRRDDCLSVFVEVNDSFKSQAAEVARILDECGFLFLEKAHSAMFDESPRHSHSFNQIWLKK